MNIKIVLLSICLSISTFFSLSSVNKLYTIVTDLELKVNSLGKNIEIISYLGTNITNPNEGISSYIIFADEEKIDNIKSYEFVKEVFTYELDIDTEFGYNLYAAEIIGRDAYLKFKDLLKENLIKIERKISIASRRSTESDIFFKTYKVYFYLNDKNLEEILKKISDIPCILKLYNGKYTGFDLNGNGYASLEEDLLN